MNSSKTRWNFDFANYSHFFKATFIEEKQCRLLTHPPQRNHLLHLKPILSQNFEYFYGISYQRAFKDVSEMTFPQSVTPTLLNIWEITSKAFPVTWMGSKSNFFLTKVHRKNVLQIFTLAMSSYPTQMLTPLFFAEPAFTSEKGSIYQYFLLYIKKDRFLNVAPNEWQVLILLLLISEGKLNYYIQTKYCTELK